MTEERHLDEIEIEMLLDGFADESQRAHLKLCQECKERLQAAYRLLRRLQIKLHRQNCPSSEILISFGVNELDTSNQRLVQNHLQTCLRCQEELAVLKAYLGDEGKKMESSQKTNSSGKNPSPLIWKLRLPLSKPMEALRGRSKERDFNFKVADRHLFLEFRRQGEVLELTGQLINHKQESWEGATLTVKHKEKLVRSTRLNDAGEFQLEIPYLMPLALKLSSKDGEEISIEEIDLEIDSEL